jgi:CRISP-associated protein Cas1
MNLTLMYLRHEAWHCTTTRIVPNLPKLTLQQFFLNFNTFVMLLVVQSYGAKLAVKDGLFSVTTIENKQYTTREYAVMDVSCIWVHNGCNFTSASVELALANDIDLLLLDHKGMPVGRFMPIRPNSIVSIQRVQLEAQRSPVALMYIKEWIIQKMTNQADLLRHRTAHHLSTSKDNPLIMKSIAQIEKQCNQLRKLKADNISSVAETIRGIEGTAGRAYFAALSELLPQRYTFENRTYQYPTDAFNTCLNYGYAILYSKVESALIKAGLNPYAAWLHLDDSQFKGMVYDFVEPYRYWVDQVLLSLFLHKTLNNSHLEQSKAEKIWLSVSGRKLIAENILAFLQAKIEYQPDLNVSRERYLLLKAQNLATSLQAQQKSENIILAPSAMKQAA